MQWRECTLVPGQNIGFYTGGGHTNKGLYRVDEKFIEIVIQSTLVSGANIAQGATLFTIEDIDVSPKIGKGSMMWNDTTKSLLMVDFNTNYTVTLGHGTFGESNWVGTSPCMIKLLR